MTAIGAPSNQSKAAEQTDASPSSKTGSRARPFVLPDPRPYAELRIFADSYWDIQKSRTGVGNRIAGVLRGDVAVDPDLFAPLFESLKADEHKAKLDMIRAYRRLVRAEMPVVEEWQKATPGIGEPLLARLLGHLGHPRIATPYHWEGEGSARKLIADPPYLRTVAQLRSYCGHGDASRRRRKGMTTEDAFALGSPTLKMLTHLIAEGAIKERGCTPISEVLAAVQRSPEHRDRLVGGYPHPARENTSTTAHSSGGEVVHPSVTPSPRSSGCALTGAVPPLPSMTWPSSTDEAAAGASSTSVGASWPYRAVYVQRRIATIDRDWTDGHAHNDALRVVGKAILRDLWEVAG